MKQVSIAAVQIKNFRSFVEETIIFPEGAGLNFLGGVNELEPRLEANGAGKTSLLEAIVWCIYGRSIRGARTSQIIQWGAENASVTVTLHVGGPSGYLLDVGRSGPPDRAYLDGNLASQEAIEARLGLTRERFLNSIIFGQGRPLFPDLSVSERGQLFDDILGLELWNRCSDIAKQRMTSAQALIQGHKLQLANIEGQLEALPSEEELQKKIDEFELERETDISEKLTEIEKLELYLASVRADLVKMPPISDKEKEKQTKADAALSAKLRIQQSSERKNAADAQILKQAQEDAKAIESGKCRLCQRPLPNAEQALYDIRQRISILEANVFNSNEAVLTARSDYQAEQDANRKFFEDLTKRRLDRQQAESRLQFVERDLAHLIKELKTIEEQVNPHREGLAAVAEERGILLMAQRDYQQQITKAESEATALDYWKSAFKQIRLFYIGEVLSSLAVEVNSAVNSLGLLGWRVQFVTETENKSGTMKLGVQIEITDPRGRKGKWEDFGSGGEEQRTRLGIGLGMASLIQRAAGVIWDIEIHDEPTQYLSPQGVTDLLDALAHRAESQGKQIWIIDHRALTHSSFKEQWTITKTSEGSKLNDFPRST